MKSEAVVRDSARSSVVLCKETSELSREGAQSKPTNVVILTGRASVPETRSSESIRSSPNPVTVRAID